MSRRCGVVALSFTFGVVAALLGSCTSHDGPSAPACVTDPSPTCKPEYDPPVYATIYDKILHPTCATGSGTCHTSDAAMGGLVFEDPDAAYDLLLGKNGAPHARVVPGNASCSLLMERLESNDPSFRMPRGDVPLAPAEICTIAKWIAAGAPR